MRRLHDALNGWSLTGALALVIVLMAFAIAAYHGFDVEAVRAVIRATARTSALLFGLAFSASALVTFWPNAWTRWQRRNRRQLGVTFAASHGLHAVAIAAFAKMDPASFAAATNLASYIFGGIGYAVIVAMTATSFDRTAAAIGPKAWRVLHLWGGYYLWVQFVIRTGLLAGPSGASPTKAAHAVPTPWMGRGPVLTSSM